jgi:hypothetical protein
MSVVMGLGPHDEYFPMKRLGIIGLVCFLSACQSTPADLPPARVVADFPAPVAEFSDCVYRAADSMGSSYIFHLYARADKREFLLTTTAIQPTLVKLELQFVTKGEITAVEMRDYPIGDHELSREIWAIVERCSQQMAKPSASKSTAP